MFNFFRRPLSQPVSQAGTQEPDPVGPAQTNPVTLASPETEATFQIGRRMTDTGEYRDRYDYDRYKILLNALEAWRVNPLVRRCVELTTQFVVGPGITITSDEQEFIDQWQSHPVNNIPAQLPEWADELWRSGNLFLVGSVDDAGMTYWRPLPAELVGELETYANDPYHLKNVVLTDMQASVYRAYKSGMKQRRFILHFPINRPAGGDWGESDLAPVLRYVSLYTDWLIDRAALNKYMKPTYINQRSFDSPEAKAAYALKVKPPTPGSTTIADKDEVWGVLGAQLNGFDAETDGLAIKRMIAAGLGFPLHYLAEPESSTRTTAEAAGTPTYRRLQQRQLWFTQVLTKVVRTTLEVRAAWSNDVDPKAKIKIISPDISERDNAQMAMSAARISAALAPYYDVLGADEFIRMVYRYAGETDVPKIDKKARPLGKSTSPGAPADSTEPASPDEQDPMAGQDDNNG